MLQLFGIWDNPKKRESTNFTLGNRNYSAMRRYSLDAVLTHVLPHCYSWENWFDAPIILNHVCFNYEMGKIVSND